MEAFYYLDNNYELIIYGSGDYEDNVKKAARIDNRIIYRGYCNNRQKLLSEQKNSDILVSLIDPNDEVSKYCFPSKIFEYMLSGNIVLSTRIKGIPEEYFKYIQPIEVLDPKIIATKIVEISKFDYLKKKTIGEDEISFLMNNKNNIVQGKRIFDFIHE